MTQISPIDKLAERKANKVRKRATKMAEIAQSAISALKKYGYARTTIRDIAAHSDMSLGRLHYYFEDKDQLLIYCVQQYKQQFVDVMAASAVGAGTAQEMLDAFCAALANTIDTEAELHRLWYDIRNQAMFDPTFGPVVTEIEERLIGLFAPFAAERAKQETLYVRFDGAFRFLLQKKLSGQEMALDTMTAVLKTAAASDL